MSSKPYFIGPIKTGLERDYEPFMLPNDAYPSLTDCYLFRGRIEKRIGNQFLGRLVEAVLAGALGNTGASPFTANIITTFPAAALGIQPGSVSIAIAAPVGPLTYLDDGLGNLNAGGGNTGTINYTSGAVSLIHPAAAASVVTVTFSYYTGRPVMGLPTRDTTDLNREETLAFDTVKANRYNTGTGRFEDISFLTGGGGPITWTGNDANFFWTWNYYVDAANLKLIWVTNNVAADRIRYYNGVAAGGWTIFRPQLDAGATRYLDTALLIVSYRNRLVVLNTTEFQGGGDVNFPQRARWSINGSPIVAATSWLDDTVGSGGYIDAPTTEQITSCRFFKDTLIVFFERSTWALVYSGNEILPFYWLQINTQFGCESSFSTVTFDKGIFAVGDKGIITADTVNVERIDQKIPDEVFNFHNQNSGPIRVQGIIDYYFQFVYWTFPNSVQNKKFPNRVLVLNYLEGAYSFYKDCYTCFGYFQSVTDRTWQNTQESWNTIYGTWASGRLQSDFPDIIAGNQQGFVMIMDQGSPNGKSLYITNITQAANAVITSPNHNLEVGQFVVFSEVEGMTGINTLTGEILSTPTANTFTVDIDSTGFAAYTRAGYITVINNIEIVSKKFNPFYQEGTKTRMNYLDFYLEKTSGGQFEVDILGDDTGYTTSIPSDYIGDALDTQTVETKQNYGPSFNIGKIWQRMYTDVSGQFLQFRIYLNGDDMRDVTIRNSNIVLHGINLWMMPSGRLFSYDRPTT